MKTLYGKPYFETVSADPGLNKLAHNTCRVIDFELLVLKAGQKWVYASEGRECGFDVLTGTASFTVGDEHFENLGGRESVFDGPPSMVYVGPNTEVAIEAITDVEIGIGSAVSHQPAEPYAVTPDDAITGGWGEGNTQRHYRYMINADRPSEKLWFTEVFVSDGRWATYPPHKHEDVPDEIFQEEMYFYRTEPEHGFGFCGQFEGQVGEDFAFLIRNNTIHKMPHGYHTVTAAPGYRVFYLAIYAGNDKRHQPVTHPDHANFQDHAIPEKPV